MKRILVHFGVSHWRSASLKMKYDVEDCLSWVSLLFDGGGSVIGINYLGRTFQE